MNQLNIHSKAMYRQVLLITALTVVSLGVSFLIANFGILIGFASVAGVIGLLVFIRTIQDVEFGFLTLVTYGYFLFLISRLIPVRIPTGVGIEIIGFIVFIGVIVNLSKNKINWELFKHPITYLTVINEFYGILQVLNPNAVSFKGWLFASRGIFFTFLLYFIVVKVFDNLSFIKRFTKWWLFLALCAGLYGMFQEYFGYRDFEWRYIYASPGRYDLLSVWTGIRKFSFLSDVAAFGMLMAFSAIFTFILALGPFKMPLKIVLVISGICMLLGMSYSGTRTATAMIPVGVMMYVLLNINNKRTIIFLVVAVIAFVGVLFGPFYNGPLERIRSTFQPSEDASMQVRDRNRKSVQPYIYSHPIGGGLMTTDEVGRELSPGHPNAGFATDSGYLETALQRGWIGLIILLALYFTIMKTGIENFYKAKDPTIKILYAAYCASFFSLSIANFAQSAMGQKPTGLIIISSYAILANMIRLDKKN
ncbi:O-antigen ligase family protein [Fulvivirga sp. M361]|uniref:O-antigen ligase family protein n=1 Tax=Fulvivirga sp. M361 TaxID=2594266 RepID=UPI00117A4A89|nr:O-antigen ligase family protein [Fulvivirga sp. M361]TRX60109.1 O-antigen ligase family protein [Fulvivirga sp. M361]